MTAPSTRSRGAAFARYGQPIGLGFIALGLLVIGIGWYGASGTGAQVDGNTLVVAQLPYLLSGGALGLGLIVVGTGLLIVHALRGTRDRMEELLVSLVDGGQLTPLVEPEAEAEPLVLAGTASFHVPSCRLAPTGSAAMTAREAAVRGLARCRACKPSSFASA